KNQADNLVFQTEKQLKEFGDKVHGDVKNRIENANNALKEAIKAGTAATIKPAIEVLNAAWNEASSQMYQQATASGQQPDGAPAGDQTPPKTEEKKVEDAQYEVVDEEKKK
ncbi:MAG: Hsp70 family protein, partial [bacterium]